MPWQVQSTSLTLPSSSTSFPTSVTNSGIPAAAKLWLAVVAARNLSPELEALRRVKMWARRRERISRATGSLKLDNGELESLGDEEPNEFANDTFCEGVPVETSTEVWTKVGEAMADAAATGGRTRLIVAKSCDFAANGMG